MSVYTPNWDKIINPLASTTTTIGGEWANLISDYFNGVNISLVHPSKKPKIGTPTLYKFETLQLLDNDESHKVSFSVDDIDTGVDRLIKIRRMNTPYLTDHMVMEGMPQTLLNKSMSGSLNTFTSIPKSALPTAAAYEDEANVFTTLQKIQFAFTNALTLYRTDNTIGSGTGINFNLQNSAGTETQYGAIYGVNNANTAGAESGSIAFYNRIGGVFTERMILTNTNTLGIGLTGARIVLDPTGIATSSKTFTFPNLSGKVTTDTFANIFTDVQTIQKDAATLLSIYRTISTTSSNVGTTFDAWSSTGIKRSYAAIYGSIVTNTNAAEDGQIRFQTMAGGTLATRMTINHNGFLFIGTNQRLVFGETNLTAQRIFTYPDIAGIVAVDMHSNYFRASQSIDVDLVDQLLLRRQNQTVGNTNGISFQAWNSTPANTNYGAIYSRIGTNTAGNETGFLDFHVRKNGTLGQYMILDGNQLSLGLSSSRVVLDATNINTSSKTFNFPNLSGQLATDTFANVFTAQQTISVSLGTGLKMYRPTSTVNAAFAIGWNFQNSVLAETNVGYVTIKQSSNTAGAETGEFEIMTRLAGANGVRLSLIGNTLGLGLTPVRAILDPVGITAERTFTFPNASAKFLGEANVAAVTNKVIDLKLNTPLRYAAVGAYHAASEEGVDAEGALKGLVSVGDQGVTTLNTGGKYHIWNTKAVIDDCAGVVKLDGIFTWRAINPLVRHAFLFVTGPNRRMFKGFTAKRLINTNSDTAPLNSNESGFMFGYGSADTNFHIFHNDATGTCVKLDTGMAIPGINTNYIVELQVVGSNFVWSLYSVDGTTSSRSTLLGTGTVSTRIPGNTTHLYLQDLIVTTTAAIVANNIHYIEVFN